MRFSLYLVFHLIAFSLGWHSLPFVVSVSVRSFVDLRSLLLSTWSFLFVSFNLFLQ